MVEMKLGTIEDTPPSPVFAVGAITGAATGYIVGLALDGQWELIINSVNDLLFD